MAKNQNEELLKNFIKYCKEAPDQRFWQALCNWSEQMQISVTKKDVDGTLIYEDTYYWDKKNEL